MGLLTCTRCKTEKPANAEFFPLHNKKHNGLDSWCRQCRREYKRGKVLPKGVSDKTRGYEARALLECVICGEPKDERFAVDHDHSTGHVRGGLCMRCNMGLGHFRDNPELLRFAALYLEGRCACGECQPYWGGEAEVEDKITDMFFPIWA
jgi:hypothetical protein